MITPQQLRQQQRATVWLACAITPSLDRPCGYTELTRQNGWRAMGNCGEECAFLHVVKPDLRSSKDGSELVSLLGECLQLGLECKQVASLDAQVLLRQQPFSEGKVTLQFARQAIRC